MNLIIVIHYNKLNIQDQSFNYVFILYFAGYGFVDFESPLAAEAAVKALQARGVQAQMAKVDKVFTYEISYYF